MHNGVAFFLLFFFFSSRRRHTRSLYDWSSDVCSSDLAVQAAIRFRRSSARRKIAYGCPWLVIEQMFACAVRFRQPVQATSAISAPSAKNGQIGRASCRERVEKAVDDEGEKKTKEAYVV